MTGPWPPGGNGRPGEDGRAGEDGIERTLRRAFEAEVGRVGAGRVEVGPDALVRLRARIRGRMRRRRAWSVGFASFATAAVVLLTVVTLGLGRPVPAGPEPTGPVRPAGGSGTISGPASASFSAGTAVTVPVYYVGTVAGRPVLFREYRSVRLADTSLPGRVAAALDLAVAGTALDPDYGTGWPAGVRVRAVTLAGVGPDAGVAVVDLRGADLGAGGVADGATVRRAAVAQLVWTATAVAADRGVQLRGVRLLVGGAAPAAGWGGVDLSGVLVRGDAATTLAPVWLIAPQQGDTVPTTFEVHLAGTAFAAAVRLRVRDATGALVVDRPVLLDAGAPARGEARVTLSLPRGRYTVEAVILSAADGSVAARDDKQITVG
jgi:hypothetical protein